jgi:hypothetical protein
MMAGSLDDRGRRARNHRRARWIAMATIVPMLALPGSVLAEEPDAPGADEVSAVEAAGAEPGKPDYVDIDAFVEQLEAESGSDDPAWLESSDTADASDARAEDGTKPAAVSSAGGDVSASPESDRSGENAFARAGEVTMDVLLLRPFGAVATVAGFGFYVASAPFLVLSGDLDTARDVFVTERARYAFDRPLGQF